MVVLPYLEKMPINVHLAGVVLDEGRQTAEWEIKDYSLTFAHSLVFLTLIKAKGSQAAELHFLNLLYLFLAVKGKEISKKDYFQNDESCVKHK